jgi:hypothetical protein
LVKRNHSYNINEVVEATGGYLLKCKVAGTTSSDPIIVGGAELVDGTVTWQVIEDSDMPSDVMITIPIPTTAVDYYIAPEDGWICGHSHSNYIVLMNLTKNSLATIIHCSNYEAIYLPCNAGDRIQIESDKPSGGAFLGIFFSYSIKSAKKLGLL